MKIYKITQNGDVSIRKAEINNKIVARTNAAMITLSQKFMAVFITLLKLPCAIAPPLLTLPKALLIGV
jgi:hypothetical protein